MSPETLSPPTKTMKPINRKILVRKCLGATPERVDGKVTYMTGGIVLTDWYGLTSNWAEVIDVSDDCIEFGAESIGGFVLLPEWSPQMMSKVKDERDNGVPIMEFIVKEELFDVVNGAKPIIVFME